MNSLLSLLVVKVGCDPQDAVILMYRLLRGLARVGHLQVQLAHVAAVLETRRHCRRGCSRIVIWHGVGRVKSLDVRLATRLAAVHLSGSAALIRLSRQAIIEVLLGGLVFVHHSAHIVVFLNGQLGRRRLRYLRRPILARAEHLGLKILLLLLHLVGLLDALHVFLHTDVAGGNSSRLLARRRRLIMQLRLEREIFIVQLLFNFALVSYLLLSLLELLPFLRSFNYGVGVATHTAHHIGVVNLLRNSRLSVHKVVRLVLPITHLTALDRLAARALL